MAHVVETAILQAVEGKTRAQQVARLKEWKKHFLAEGADKITVFEVGPGNMNGEWVFTIHHKRAALHTVRCTISITRALRAMIRLWKSGRRLQL